jgi:hypothetical protein
MSSLHDVVLGVPGGSPDPEQLMVSPGIELMFEQG